MQPGAFRGPAAGHAFSRTALPRPVFITVTNGHWPCRNIRERTNGRSSRNRISHGSGFRRYRYCTSGCRASTRVKRRPPSRPPRPALRRGRVCDGDGRRIRAALRAGISSNLLFRAAKAERAPGRFCYRAEMATHLTIVTTGLVPVVHAVPRWIAGTSPAMTASLSSVDSRMLWRTKKRPRKTGAASCSKPEAWAYAASASSSWVKVGPESWPLASTSRSTNSITASGALSP
jgi:hypothetical protein